MCPTRGHGDYALRGTDSRFFENPCTKSDVLFGLDDALVGDLGSDRKILCWFDLIVLAEFDDGEAAEHFH